MYTTCDPTAIYYADFLAKGNAQTLSFILDYLGPGPWISIRNERELVTRTEFEKFREKFQPFFLEKGAHESCSLLWASALPKESTAKSASFSLWEFGDGFSLEIPFSPPSILHYSQFIPILFASKKTWFSSLQKNNPDHHEVYEFDCSQRIIFRLGSENGSRYRVIRIWEQVDIARNKPNICVELECIEV
jgi:hypothetical protein